MALVTNLQAGQVAGVPAAGLGRGEGLVDHRLRESGDAGDKQNNRRQAKPESNSHVQKDARTADAAP